VDNLGALRFDVFLDNLDAMDNVDSEDFGDHVDNRLLLRFSLNGPFFDMRLQ